MANAAVPAAPAFPLSENPPLSAQAGAVDTESEKGEEQGIPHPEEGNKSPADKEERDDDRSRSPKLRALNQTLTTRQASWLPPLPWPSGSRR